jgi:hypothetical protein
MLGSIPLGRNYQRLRGVLGSPSIVMPFISNTANFEDVLLWRAFQEINGGFYIDAGATDPELDSVTRAFYEAGWTGINIVSDPRCFEPIRQLRPRDLNMLGQLGRTAGFTGSPIVPLLSLKELLENHSPEDIQFLRITADSASADTFAEPLPKAPAVILFCGRSPESFNRSFNDLNYDLVYTDGLNRFYLKRDKLSLRTHFVLPPNAEDDFVSRAQWDAEQRCIALTATVRNLERQAADLRTAVKDASSHAESLANAFADARDDRARLRHLVTEEGILKNYLLERVRQLETDLRLKNEKRSRTVLERLQTAGQWATSGGPRRLVYQTALAGMRRAVRQPILLNWGSRLLQPFPRLTARISRAMAPALPPAKASAAGPLSSDDPYEAGLPTPALLIYRKLQVALSPELRS